MIQTTFFWPAFSLVLLSICVMLRMLAVRVGQMKAHKIHPQSISTSIELLAKMPDTRISDNFRNLFETPTLFYAGIVFASITAQSGPLLISLAWLYVGLRVIHSIIQCSYNKVMHRFYVFLASIAVLLAFWATMAVGLSG